jgi:hypothetical protein
LGDYHGISTTLSTGSSSSGGSTGGAGAGAGLEGDSGGDGEYEDGDAEEGGTEAGDGQADWERMGDLQLAEQLAATCYELYRRSPSGLAPEIVHFAERAGEWARRRAGS